MRFTVGDRVKGRPGTDHAGRSGTIIRQQADGFMVRWDDERVTWTPARIMPNLFEKVRVFNG